MEKRNCKVCVTGGTGYVGSLLVKKLLERGYTVHATMRNLSDSSKVDLLKSFPHADTRLVLFQADIYNPDEFEHAIKGCEFAFHVATPKQITEGSQSLADAAIAGVKSIAMSCIQSGSVRRLIYTASMTASSPLKIDGSGFNDFVDETCWTPLNLSFAYANGVLRIDVDIGELRLNPGIRFWRDESEAYIHNAQGYVESKTLAEKEILSYGDDKIDGSLEVVTLPCGLIGGETVLHSTPGSVWLFISQLINYKEAYDALRFVEEMLGNIPVVHVDDVCEAHIFCMENTSITGRFFCANACTSSTEIITYYQQNHPEFPVKQGDLDGPKTEITWDFTKLVKKGFAYKHDTRSVLEDSIRCAKRMGVLSQ